MTTVTLDLNAKSKEVNSEILVGHLSTNLKEVFFLRIGLYISQYQHLFVLYLLFFCSDVKRCWYEHIFIELKVLEFVCGVKLGKSDRLMLVSEYHRPMTKAEIVGFGD